MDEQNSFEVNLAMYRFAFLMLMQKPGDSYWLEQMDLHFCAALRQAKSMPGGLTHLENFFARMRSTSTARGTTRRSKPGTGTPSR